VPWRCRVLPVHPGRRGSRVRPGPLVPAALTSGQVLTQTITLSRTMADTTYRAVATLSGNATGLGAVVVQGITARTTTTVTVQLRASAAVTVANLPTVEVLASAG
jgi:hypothetical protein